MADEFIRNYEGRNITIDHPEFSRLQPCCGDCGIRVDASHLCVICGQNLCNMCKQANYDGSEIEVSRKFCICRKHPSGIVAAMFLNAPLSQTSTSRDSRQNVPQMNPGEVGDIVCLGMQIIN